MKELLYGEKLVSVSLLMFQALKTSEINVVNVPRFEELSVKKMY